MVHSMQTPYFSIIKRRGGVPGRAAAGRGSSVRGCGGGWKGLVDLNLAIALYMGEGLHDAAGPTDLDFIGESAGAKAEVHARIAGGEIAAGGGDGDPLRCLRAGAPDDGADAVAVALVPGEMKRDPVIGGVGLIVEHVRR